MVAFQGTDFDADRIWRSGQCFRMREAAPGSFTVLAGDRSLSFQQIPGAPGAGGKGAPEEGVTLLFDCEEQEFEDFWRPYFDLDTDYAAFRDRIDQEDLYLSQAAECGKGIRILRQDPWEMIVTFLISQQNNIARIRRCIENICASYGEERRDRHGCLYHAFPLPAALADLPENALLSCNLGYRSKYVVRAARAAADGSFPLAGLAAMTYPEAREELRKLFGVGGKVADCVCLFGLHHLMAFPVDTHISQALAAHYPDGFPMERYAGFQGVLQQYIFYRELAGGGEKA